MSSFPNTTNFDNLLLQYLVTLQLRPSKNPLLSQFLQDLLFDAANNLSDHDENYEKKSQLHIGKTDSLKPNSGQAVTIGDHHICVGFHEEKGLDYRVWELDSKDEEEEEEKERKIDMLQSAIST